MACSRASAIARAVLPALAAAGLAALLSGCVAYPDYGYYSPGYGYYAPGYYASPYGYPGGGYVAIGGGWGWGGHGWGDHGWHR